MMKFILIQFLAVLVLISCQHKEPKNQIEFKKLRDSAGGKFYKEYKTFPWIYEDNNQIVETLIELGKPVHNNHSKLFENSLNEIDSFVKSTYKRLNLKNKMVFEILSDIKNSKDPSNSLYLVEYLIINDIIIDQARNHFKIDDIKAEIAYKQFKDDSLELYIYPRAEILYYNPLIILNNDTINPENLNKGAGVIKLHKQSQELQINGSYTLRKGSSQYKVSLDTILKLKN